jgi:nucleotide-binding universal stress UspA family protein
MKRFKDVLCVVTPRVELQPALERAVTLAENNQASLTVVDVIEPMTSAIARPEGGPDFVDLQAATVKAHEQELHSQIESYRQRVEIGTKVLAGTPFLEIIREVLRNGRDLVIKTTETAEWLIRILSSDDMHLLRKCPCPVWLIKTEARIPFQRILAAVDASESYPTDELQTRQALNQQILEMASSLALSESAELHVVYAWQAFGENYLRDGFGHTPEEKIIAYVEKTRQQHRRGLDTLMRELMSSMGPDALNDLKPKIHFIKGRARQEIPVVARQIEADLVVMGTVARTGIPGFIIGNTAETILNQIDGSVLAIKPRGFVTPVTLEE